jgi:hypothetical protein
MLYFKLQFVCSVWLTTTWYSTQWRYYISPSSSNRKTKVVCSIHPQVYFPSFVCVCVCVCLLCSNIVLYTPDTSTACLYALKLWPTVEKEERDEESLIYSRERERDVEQQEFVTQSIPVYTWNEDLSLKFIIQMKLFLVFSSSHFLFFPVFCSRPSHGCQLRLPRTIQFSNPPEFVCLEMHRSGSPNQNTSLPFRNCFLSFLSMRVYIRTQRFELCL